ncbi:MAG: hypothetical protein U0M13_02485, partial [Desulfovibrio fairfieldensis]|nr:hypothetical protein [Desulfovibrio fairfieldensis]
SRGGMAYHPYPSRGHTLQGVACPADTKSRAHIAGHKPRLTIEDGCSDLVGLKLENGGMGLTRHDASKGTFQVHKGNPQRENCRTLKTALGAADYLPQRVLYFIHARQTCQEFYPEKGQKKRPDFRMAWPPRGFFRAV